MAKYWLTIPLARMLKVLRSMPRAITGWWMNIVLPSINLMSMANFSIASFPLVRRRLLSQTQPQAHLARKYCPPSMPNVVTIAVLRQWRSKGTNSMPLFRVRSTTLTPPMTAHLAPLVTCELSNLISTLKPSQANIFTFSIILPPQVLREPTKSAMRFPLAMASLRWLNAMMCLPMLPISWSTKSILKMPRTLTSVPILPQFPQVRPLSSYPPVSWSPPISIQLARVWLLMQPNLAIQAWRNWKVWHWLRLIPMRCSMTTTFWLAFLRDWGFWKFLSPKKPKRR